MRALPRKVVPYDWVVLPTICCGLSLESQAAKGTGSCMTLSQSAQRVPTQILSNLVMEACWCAAVARVGAVVDTAVERRQEAVAPGKLIVQ